MCYRKISLFCKKLWKNIIGIVFKEKYDSGGALKFLWSPIIRVLRVVATNGFRCFTPVLKALSDNINTLKLKNAFNPFWWRQPLWRHNLTFCVKQKLKIICSTMVVYLANLVKKWKEIYSKRQVNIALMKQYLRGGLALPCNAKHWRICWGYFLFSYYFFTVAKNKLYSI